MKHRIISVLEKKRDSISVWLDSANHKELNRKLNIKKLASEEIIRHRVSLARADLLHQTARDLVRAGASKKEAFIAAKTIVGRAAAIKKLQKADNCST